MRTWRSAFLGAFVLGACQPLSPPNPLSPSVFKTSGIRPDALLQHVRVLASDDFEGREPGTPGENLAIRYIERQFREASLAPQTSGLYLQSVPIIRRSAGGQLTIVENGNRLRLSPNVDFTVQLLDDSLKIENAPAVFAGYGIIAPEFGRNDYDGIDVRDKIVFVLTGEPHEMFDPSYAKIGPDAAAALAAAKRTYHRWDWVKQHNALIRGATGIVIVASDTKLASKSKYFQQDYMTLTHGPPWAPSLSMMLSQSAFDQIAKAAGTSAEALQQSARAAEFRARPLNLRLEGTFNASETGFASHNVVGRIPGSGKGCIIMTAHWDGYGIERSVPGDNIWNGAVDDAGGVAQLIEIARHLATAKRPRRTIIFVATTGEERGFLGARHLLANPPCPQGEIAAVINLDWFWELGRTRQFASHGLGYTTLDPIVQKLAAVQDRTVTATNAYFAGGDQLPFLFAGIPGIHGGSWGTLIDRTEGFEEAYSAKVSEGAILREGNSNRDEVRDEWDLSGAVLDAELLLNLALELANTRDAPCWTAPSQFASTARRCR